MINKLKIFTLSEEDIDNPTSPAFVEFLSITANKDAKKVIKFPINSSRIASHLKVIK